MRALTIAILVALPANAFADEIRIVPAYTGSPDDLVVVRTSTGGCADDLRASRVVHSYSGGTLTLSLPAYPPDVVCTAVVRLREMAYTMRELGMTEFPSTLTVRYGTTELQQSFAKQPAFSGTPQLAAGWWKTSQGTLSWHQSDAQLGVLVTGQGDDGAATWRIGAGTGIAGRGSFGLFEVSKGTTLSNETVGERVVVPDGTFEYVVEGPALAWVRFAGTDIWAPSRPYYFDEETSSKGSYFSLYNAVPLAGNWRVAADDTQVQIEQMPTDPIEGSQPYIVMVAGQRGTLRCDSDSCQFDASLPAPLGGTDVPNAGITDDRMSLRTPAGWATLLIRDK